MAEIVNLRLARKRKQREEKAVQAGNNRLLYGISKTKRQLSKAEREKQSRNLDAHRRETPDEE